MTRDDPSATPPIAPMTMAKAKPTSVVINVCHEFSKIGTRQCHSSEKIADGAGSTNSGTWKPRTKISQNTNMPAITTHGSACRTGLRSKKLVRLTSVGNSSLAATCVRVWSGCVGACCTDVLPQFMHQLYGFRVVGVVERPRP